MKYVFLLLFMGLVFGLCFLVDKGIGALKRRAAGKPVVRLPVWYPALCALLLPAGLGCGAYAIINRSWLFAGAALCLLAVAGYAMYCYRGTRIDYDDAEFTFRSGKTEQRFRFSHIDGQRVSISKRGCCLVLCIGSDQVVLYSNMQGFAPFLEAAFAAWCRERGLSQSEQGWHDPENYQWFPDQPDEEA